MKGSQDSAFKRELKEMIIEECGKELSAADIGDDHALFGEDTDLELDSLDGLQISMAIQRRYGHRVADPKELRRIMASVNTLADFLRPA